MSNCRFCDLLNFIKTYGKGDDVLTEVIAKALVIGAVCEKNKLNEMCLRHNLMLNVVMSVATECAIREQENEADAITENVLKHCKVK